MLAGQHLPVPGRLEVDAHDEDAVGARLRDQRLPDEVLERVVLVAADDEVDAGHLPGHPLVGRHVLVGHGHHDRPAPGPEVGHGPARRGDGIAELDPGARARRLGGIGHGEPEEPDRDAIPLDHVRGARPTERLAGGAIQHVRGDPGEARLPHAREQRGRPEVELVVAEGGDVESQLVPRGNHLLAPQHRRHDGWRDGVPGERQQGMRRLLPRPGDEGRDPRHPALLPGAVRRLQDVVVVELEKREAYGRPVRLARHATREESGDEDRQEGAARADHWAPFSS
jgi:hypothetical protein